MIPNPRLSDYYIVVSAYRPICNMIGQPTAILGLPCERVSCANGLQVVNAVNKMRDGDVITITVGKPATEYASSETAYGRTVGYGFAVKVF